MQSKCTYNHCVLCSAVNIVYWERNKEFLFFKHKTFASKRSLWQQHSVNSSVRLPNHYTRAKLKKVLAITSKDSKKSIFICYIQLILESRRH